MGLLDGKVAVVTGGAGGIGGAISRSFAAQGARVVVNDVDLPRLDETLAARKPVLAWKPPVTAEAAGIFSPGRKDTLYVHYYNHLALATKLADEADVAWSGEGTMFAKVTETLRA